MKKIVMLVLFISTQSFTQSYYLNIYSDGKVTSIPVLGIQRISFSSISDINTIANQSIITSFELFQNYPNPFNPSTNIAYQINESGDVKVNVYNINGELVKTLVNEFQSTGQYKIIWDGTDNSKNSVATGVYICRVVFGNSLLSRKMLLLK